MAERLCRGCGDPLRTDLGRNNPRTWCADCNPDPRRRGGNRPTGPRPRPESRLAPERTVECAQCGDVFVTRISRKKFCSVRCQRREERQRHRREGRHLKPIACSHCGQTFLGDPNTRPSRQRRYCSPECQYEDKRWLYMKRSHPVPWADCSSCGSRFIDRRGKGECFECVPARTRRPAQCPPHSRWISDAPMQGTWIAGSCHQCGESYVGRWHPLWPCRYCSDRCIKRAAKTRRRARKRNAWVEEVWRPKVYERDNWTCRICHEPVDRDAEVPDPLAPTLDHIVPLALGGDHSYANVQCAHYRCNSLKGAACEGQLHFAA